MPSISFQRQCELETALMDATRAAQVVAEWMGQALDFEKSDPPTLNKADSANINWAVNMVAHLISEADRIFHAADQ